MRDFWFERVSAAAVDKKNNNPRGRINRLEVRCC